MKNTLESNTDAACNTVTDKNHIQTQAGCIEPITAIRKVYWKSKAAVIFQDTLGRIWKYQDKRIYPAVLRGNQWV